MARHLDKAELQAGVPRILESPSNDGTLDAIVIRLAEGEREELDSCEMSLQGGMRGDHWAKGCWMSTEAGEPHPDVQICIMNSRCIDLIADDRSRWALAGDNLFIDLDLRPQNLPAGTRLAIGSALLEITDTPHNGCAKFAERFGQAAVVFVNSPQGKAQRRRGIYARVVRDGKVTVGARITKVA